MRAHRVYLSVVARNRASGRATRLLKSSVLELLKEDILKQDLVFFVFFCLCEILVDLSFSGQTELHMSSYIPDVPTQ